MTQRLESCSPGERREGNTIERGGASCGADTPRCPPPLRCSAARPAICRHGGFRARVR
jgi:hypothetical protein